MKITRTEGRRADVFTLENQNGCRLTVTNYGARLMQLLVPDRNGVPGDVLAGFDTPEEYMGDNPYFGAVLGRVANRIANACVTLNGKRYDLDANDGTASLHGGFSGFDRRFWDAKIGEEGVQFFLRSPAGDQGFPARLDVTVRVGLSEDNEVSLDYAAVSDGDTFCSLSNHSYFRLGGRGSGDVLGQELRLNSAAISVFDEEKGRGTVLPTAGTAFDFSKRKPVGRDIGAHEPLLERWGGYDFNYIIDGTGLRTAAELWDPVSGRTLEMKTDAPGVQLYTGNFLDITGKETYGKHAALCLEAQGYPYAPNEPGFPSVVLKKGETYRQRTVYRFGVGK